MSSDAPAIFTTTINNPVDGSPLIPLNSLLPSLTSQPLPQPSVALFYKFVTNHLQSFPPPSAITMTTPAILASLAANSTSPDVPTLQAISECLSTYLEFHSSSLAENLSSVCSFMLSHLTSRLDPNLSTACTEFFHILFSPQTQLPPGAFQGLLTGPALLPPLLAALLGNMVYSDAEGQALLAKNRSDLCEVVRPPPPPPPQLPPSPVSLSLSPRLR
jgi:hypothetical protein